ncbi:MAG: IS256 family transposase [Spirochaetae bacterium HGW-Spirochaetae-2]|jgi:transposase-like protein|nr:MAG: IS256 family transposase [Spirochaetae bacterium HGW-Spirochaetae-2]
MTDSNVTKELEKKLLSFITEEDPMLCMLQWITEKFMEIEVANKVGVQKGEHSTDRTTHRSGTRIRRFDTRMGTMYLNIPKLRKGEYVPFFVTAKKRSEQTLMQIIQEAWVCGISTRKIERLAKSMGIEQISASQVSSVNKELDAMVDEFRNRPLQEEYPILWIDALYEKIREHGHVVSMAVLVVKGVAPDGAVQILAVEPMHNESEETYRTLFQNLKDRGVERVWLCISDAHKGLQAAIRKEFTGTSWQRCKVHFMRNILVYVGHRHKDAFAKQLKHIWLQPDEKQARSYAESLMDTYGEQFPEAIRCLEEGLEDSLQFYRFDRIDHRKISSTNTLERLNREIRRRSKVVGIFPNKDSYIRLVTTYLIEYEEEWQSGRAYVSVQSLTEQRLKLEEVA